VGAVAIIGGIVALVSAGITALIGGYWQRAAERQRADAEMDRSLLPNFGHTPFIRPR
jgi:hypothetical protein